MAPQLEHYAAYAVAARLVAGKRVLDVAGNPPIGAALLSGAGAAAVITGDIAALDATSAPFDVIVALSSIEPLHDCRKFLRPDGLFLTLIPAAPEQRERIESSLRDAFPARILLPLLLPSVEATSLLALCSPTPRDLPLADARLDAGEWQQALRMLEGECEHWRQHAEAAREAHAWRTVAQERDEALEELERINHWLEDAVRERDDKIQALYRDRARLEDEIGHRTFRGRLKARLKAIFPADSRRGQAVRRLARQLLQRSA